MLDLTGLLADWLPMAYVAPDDLLPGDLVTMSADDGKTWELVGVCALESVMNPAFRPIRFTDDTTYARDMRRDFEVKALVYRRHGERDFMGRNMTELAYLAGRQPTSPLRRVA